MSEAGETRGGVQAGVLEFDLLGWEPIPWLKFLSLSV